jgi:hypothetical protein
MDGEKKHMTALNTLCYGFMKSTSDDLNKLVRDQTEPFFVNRNIHDLNKKCTIIFTLSEVLKQAVNGDVYFQPSGEWVYNYTQAIDEVQKRISDIQTYALNAAHHLNGEDTDRKAYIAQLILRLDQYTVAFQRFLSAIPEKEEGMHVGFEPSNASMRAGLEPFKLNNALKHITLRLDNILDQKS